MATYNFDARKFSNVFYSPKGDKVEVIKFQRKFYFIRINGRDLDGYSLSGKDGAREALDAFFAEQLLELSADAEVTEVTIEPEHSEKEYCYVNENNEIVAVTMEEIVERKAEILGYTTRLAKQVFCEQMNHNGLAREIARNTFNLNNMMLDDLSKNQYGHRCDTTLYFLNVEEVIDNLICVHGAV